MKQRAKKYIDISSVHAKIKKEKSRFLFSFGMVNLQGVVEELVHLGDAGGDAEVDGSVADLDDKSANDIRVDLVGDLELLALTDVLGLGDGSLQAGQRLAVKSLQKRCQLVSLLFVYFIFMDMSGSVSRGGGSIVRRRSVCTNLSAGDLELDLAAGSRHNLSELLANTLQETQSVVLSESLEEVLDSLRVAAGLLGQLVHNGGLVLGGQGRSSKDRGQLSIPLDDVVEVGESLGGRIEG